MMSNFLKHTVFVTESRGKVNFESVRRDLVLLLINFTDENAYLHLYVVSKRHTYNFERIFLVLGIFTRYGSPENDHVVSTRV